MLKNKNFEYFFLNPKNQRNSTVVQIMCEYTTINITGYLSVSRS